MLEGTKCNHKKYQNNLFPTEISGLNLEPPEEEAEMLMTIL